jgi:hypothetical protein
MGLSSYVFDALDEDAGLAPCRATTERAQARFMSHTSRPEGCGYIITSVDGRVALACRRVIGTEVS